MTPSTDPLTLLQPAQASAPEPAMAPYRQRDFLRFLLCPPFYWMLLLLVVEAALAAATTALIIAAGRDMAQEDFLLSDFVWIVVTQSASYVLGATSWIFAERAGFGAYGRYMLRFARDNRHTPALLNDKNERERAEPFLTNETFHIFFELTYELEADLKLFFSLIFNAIVLGFAIDAGLPVVYAAVFAALLLLQFVVRRPVAAAYLKQQRTTNRMTAHTYTAWDNITTGNRYNFRLWHAGFKSRLRAALDAQIRAILAKEGIAAVCGIFSLVVIFGYLAWVAGRNVTDAGVLIALAATLPRQIEMSYSLHGLASGWNDLLAVWTRMGGACQAMRPTADSEFDQRIRFEGIVLQDGPNRLACSSLDEAVAHLQARPYGRLAVRGSNGSGKSTLLAALKGRLGADAFYWPTSDKLAFAFAHGRKTPETEEVDDIDGIDDVASATGAVDAVQPIQPPVKPAAPEAQSTYAGYSSGERQLKSLAEIASHTQARVYLLDEWDANLDAKNRSSAEHLVALLAARALVVEISHRDRV